MVLALCLGAVLAGCEGGAGLFQSLSPPGARPVDTRPAARKPVARPAPPVRPPVAATPQPAVEAEVVSLSGAPAARIEALFGAPASRVASGTGERWTYRAADCTLDLFLFPDVTSGGLAVLDRRASGAAPQDCVRRLRDAGRR